MASFGLSRLHKLIDYPQSFHLSFSSIARTGRCCCKQNGNESTVQCGMRDKGRPRKPLSRGRVLSTEAIQAVQALKRAKNKQYQVDHVYNEKVSRLVKPDLLATLAELQRQNECDLALEVFDLVRKELWYKPDPILYADMLLMVGRNRLVDKAEWLFSELKKEGVEPDTRICTELLCAYTEAGLIEKAMEVYETMKEKSSCVPNELTFIILISSLEKVEKMDIANCVRRDSAEFLNDPMKVLNKSHK